MIHHVAKSVDRYEQIRQVSPTSAGCGWLRSRNGYWVDGASQPPKEEQPTPTKHQAYLLTRRRYRNLERMSLLSHHRRSDGGGLSHQGISPWLVKLTGWMSLTQVLGLHARPHELCCLMRNAAQFVHPRHHAQFSSTRPSLALSPVQRCKPPHTLVPHPSS